MVQGMLNYRNRGDRYALYAVEYTFPDGELTGGRFPEFTSIRKVIAFSSRSDTFEAPLVLVTSSVEGEEWEIYTY
jgi:hypothetical protein